jgi:hypothetical protein
VTLHDRNEAPDLLPHELIVYGGAEPH